MYGFAPSRRCSSTVALPPVNAFITFFRAWVSVSVVKMLDSGMEADILPPGPRRLGRSLLWIRAGFGYPSFGATSRVIRKWGSWSMPQGIRTGTSLPASTVGRNAGAAWMLV